MDSYSLILTVFRDVHVKKESMQSITILSPQITSSLERKDQLRGSDLAVPTVVRVMHENGFATQPLLVLLEFRLGLHCPLPPSLPPCFSIPTLLISTTHLSSEPMGCLITQTYRTTRSPTLSLGVGYSFAPCHNKSVQNCTVVTSCCQALC